MILFQRLVQLLRIRRSAVRCVYKFPIHRESLCQRFHSGPVEQVLFVVLGITVRIGELLYHLHHGSVSQSLHRFHIHGILCSLCMCGIEFLSLFLHHLCKAVQIVEVFVKSIHQIRGHFAVLLHHQRGILYSLGKLCRLTAACEGQYQKPRQSCRKKLFYSILPHK